MTINEIKGEIKSLAGNNADFYNKLNPTGKPSLGVRIPDLRNIAKRIAREDYECFLQNNPMDTFEEETLEAFVIGYAKDCCYEGLDTRHCTCIWIKCRIC